MQASSDMLELIPISLGEFHSEDFQDHAARDANQVRPAVPVARLGPPELIEHPALLPRK